MYCPKCGQQISNRDTFCPHCGTATRSINQTPVSDDRPNFGLAILGFILPLVGLIIYFIDKNEHPRRAKSAVKGALTRFIAGIVIVVLALLSGLGHLSDSFDDVSDLSQWSISTTDTVDPASLVDIQFGEFVAQNNGYYYETELKITVTNQSDTRYTYYITIEAVDENGARLGTDSIYADRLNPGQSIALTAFEYVNDEYIDSFLTGYFKVLEISCYER